jgi:hypothetical protein
MVAVHCAVAASTAGLSFLAGPEATTSANSRCSFPVMWQPKTDLPSLVPSAHAVATKGEARGPTVGAPPGPLAWWQYLLVRAVQAACMT